MKMGVQIRGIGEEMVIKKEKEEGGIGRKRGEGRGAEDRYRLGRGVVGREEEEEEENKVYKKGREREVRKSNREERQGREERTYRRGIRVI